MMPLVRHLKLLGRTPARWLAAFAAGLYLSSSACVPYPATADERHAPSRALSKPLHDAQVALREKRWGEAIAKSKEADRMSGKTGYDQHVINEFLANAYLQTGDWADAARRAEAEIDDGFTSAKEQSQLARSIAELNYPLKNYDKVISFGNRALRGGSDDSGRMHTLVAQAYYLDNDFGGVIRFQGSVIEAQLKAGQTPSKSALLLFYSACVKASNQCSSEALQALGQLYPESYGAWAELPRPQRRDGPMRADNLTDDEAWQIRSVLSDVAPGAIFNIGTVVTGCQCQDGRSCSEQVWVVGHRAGKETDLVLSKIDGGWQVGVVQQWWLDMDDLWAQRGALSRDAFEQALATLNKRRPSCSTTKMVEK
jgi:hypothetical protein